VVNGNTAGSQQNPDIATWEDRRGGANGYFSLSANGGTTWAKNIEMGTGLGGDQFNPAAVIDVAGNVYVAFQDTTSGARVVGTAIASVCNGDPMARHSGRRLYCSKAS